MADLAFVLLSRVSHPTPTAVLAAAEKLGIAMTLESSDDVQSYNLGNGRMLMAALMNAPHPDMPTMAFGPTSVPPPEAIAAPAHLIVTALGLDGSERERDTLFAALVACVIAGSPAVGAMLGHGVIMHKAKLFAELAMLGMREGALPPELAIDITTARESETHMSFLTHNMPRYGREDLYVTCAIQGKGAYDFVLLMTRWMLTDLSKQFPTGETVGRTADEKIRIQRVPNPTGNGATVIKLAM